MTTWQYNASHKFVGLASGNFCIRLNLLAAIEPSERPT